MARVTGEFLSAAIAEGEGIGTAYEYRARRRVLDALGNGNGEPRRILIAGLPEKYGFSLDFVIFARDAGCSIDVIDERPEVIDAFTRLLRDFAGEEFTRAVRIKQSGLDAPGIGDAQYDLAFSSAVLQRLDAPARTGYIRSLSRVVRRAVLFAPNKMNRAHERLTGLRTLSVDELSACITDVDGTARVLSAGSVDAPFFPPGISIPAASRRAFACGRICRTALIPLLDCWSYLESLSPACIRDRVAHMVYVIAEFKT